MSARHTDFRSWNRWILYSYWIFIAAALSLSQFAFMTSGERGWIAPEIPVVAVSALVAAVTMELALKLQVRYIEYLVIAIGFVIVMVVQFGLGHYIPSIYIALCIPIMASICYFKRALLAFAGILCLGGYFVLLSVSSVLQNQVHSNDSYAVFGIVAGLTIVGLAIITRGKELQRSLDRALMSEVEAFADSVAIENVSKTDYLTGLYNHITYQEYASLLVKQYAAGELPLQLAVLDIDNFKQINDTFGHHVGDMVLKQTAAILRSSISIEDIAARYGGEEFVLLLTGKTVEQAEQLLDCIRANLADTVFQELGDHRVTASIGMTGYRSGMDKDQLFVEADSYLYQAKRFGKNCVASPLGIGGYRQ